VSFAAKPLLRAQVGAVFVGAGLLALAAFPWLRAWDFALFSAALAAVGWTLKRA